MPILSIQYHPPPIHVNFAKPSRPEFHGMWHQKISVSKNQGLWVWVARQAACTQLCKMCFTLCVPIYYFSSFSITLFLQISFSLSLFLSEIAFKVPSFLSLYRPLSLFMWIYIINIIQSIWSIMPRFNTCVNGKTTVVKKSLPLVGPPSNFLQITRKKTQTYPPWKFMTFTR